ncbi:hypothetical protein ACIBL6_15040 [Streptomyces sp. NPDC050400]|uniref:hypothetical protein n=1 Tax=Streptomyces sp. NPDC050400 TaxID=3365610 RepID=UPI0037877526
MAKPERRSACATVAMVVSAVLLWGSVTSGQAAAAAPRDPCATRPSACPDVRFLYDYAYGLGFHPFTEPHAVRELLTDHFWLFPVSGGCRHGDLYVGRECDLLGGNPVRVELVGDDFLQIDTLPGHDLGSDLHIRFTFSRSLGLHFLNVRAWQNSPEEYREHRLRSEAGRLFAWPLWAVLAETLTVAAYGA